MLIRVMCLCFSGKELHLVLPGFLRGVTDAVFLCSFVTCQIGHNMLAYKSRASSCKSYASCSWLWRRPCGKHSQTVLGRASHYAWPISGLQSALLTTRLLPSCTIFLLFLFLFFDYSHLRHKAFWFLMYNIGNFHGGGKYVKIVFRSISVKNILQSQISQHCGSPCLYTVEWANAEK